MLFKVVTLWPGLLFWQTLMAAAPQKAKVHVRTSLEAITLESATFAQLRFFNCTNFNQCNFTQLVQSYYNKLPLDPTLPQAESLG